MFKFKKSLIGLVSTIAILASFTAEARETTPYSVTISPTVVTENSKFKVSFRLTSSSAQYAQVYIRDAKGRVNSRWYTRASAHCSSTRQTCWVTSNIPAKAGTNKVYVRAWSRAKSYSSWSAAKSFVAKKKLSKRKHNNPVIYRVTNTAKGQYPVLYFDVDHSAVKYLILTQDINGSKKTAWVKYEASTCSDTAGCYYTFGRPNAVGRNTLTIATWDTPTRSTPISTTFNIGEESTALTTRGTVPTYKQPFGGATWSLPFNGSRSARQYKVTGSYIKYTSRLTGRIATEQAVTQRTSCNANKVTCDISVHFNSNLIGHPLNENYQGKIKRGTYFNIVTKIAYFDNNSHRWTQWYTLRYKGYQKKPVNTGALERRTFRVPSSVSATNGGKAATIRITMTSKNASGYSISTSPNLAARGGTVISTRFGDRFACTKMKGENRCWATVSIKNLTSSKYNVSLKKDGKTVVTKSVSIRGYKGSSSTRKVPTPTDLRVISSTWTRLKFKDIGAADYRVNVYDLTGRKWLAHYHWSRSKLQCNGSTCNIGMKNGVRNHRTKVEIYNTAKTTDKYVGYHYIK